MSIEKKLFIPVGVRNGIPREFKEATEQDMEELGWVKYIQLMDVGELIESAVEDSNEIWKEKIQEILDNSDGYVVSFKRLEDLINSGKQLGKREVQYGVTPMPAQITKRSKKNEQ